MANTIRHKRGTTVPLAGNLQTGEIAINTTNGFVYTKTDAGGVVKVNGETGGPFLPLAGGTMDNNSNISIISDVSSVPFSQSYLAGDMFKISDSTDPYTRTLIDKGQISVGNEDGSVTISPTEIYFPDGTSLSYGLGANLWAAIDSIGGFAKKTWVSASYAPLASPALTGVPTAPTPISTDNSTTIATTAFVTTAISSATTSGSTYKVVETCRNATGSLIPARSVVYINGANGTHPTIQLARANAESTSYRTFGITSADIANSADGTVVIIGEILNVNTGSFVEGDQLYLSPTIAGGITNVKPSAPDHMVYVGVCTRANTNNGSIEVKVVNGFELNELHDVAISGKADNDLVAYESSTGLWKNKTYSSLGLATLASPTFTGTPSLPTGATGITQSAGDNTTALATTAFVRTAVPAFATNAELIASSSTTTVISPKDYRMAGLTTNVFAPTVSLATGLISGTGASTSSGVSALVSMLISPNALTAGYATRGINIHYGSNSVNAGYNFSTPSGHSVRIYNSTWGNTYTGVKIRGVLGRQAAVVTVPAPLAARAYGWEWDWSTRTMNIIAFNTATGLTTTPVTWNPSNFRTYEITATSDGAGTISLYVDGVLLGTSSGGPTGTSTTGFVWFQTEIQSEATATTGNLNITMVNPKAYTTNG